MNGEAQSGASSGVAVFCFWLFAACLVVCLTFMASVLVTLVKLVKWYKAIYKPLKASLVGLSTGGERVGLLSVDRKELVGEGSSSRYRSVLFVHTEGKATAEVHGGEDEARSHAAVQRLPVVLELRGAQRASEGGEPSGSGVEAVVYRKTVCRLIGREEEIGAWRDVMEECQMSAEAGEKDGERKDETGSAGWAEAASGKCYSLILRENVEQTGGGKEEVDWVIGGWQFRQGGGEEEPRISWGQWLTDYLPSLPWGLSSSPDRGAAH